MAWLKAFFSALIPTLPAAAFSTFCAAILCGLNFAVATVAVGVFKNGFDQIVSAFLFMIIGPPSWAAFLLTLKFSFFPNLIGIFLILFSSLLKNQWPVRLSKYALYVCGGGDGIAICITAMLLMIKKWAMKAVISSLLFSLTLLPAAILSGIITFQLIVYLLRYKFPPEKAA